MVHGKVSKSIKIVLDRVFESILNGPALCSPVKYYTSRFNESKPFDGILKVTSEFVFILETNEQVKVKVPVSKVIQCVIPIPGKPQSFQMTMQVDGDKSSNFNFNIASPQDFARWEKELSSRFRVVSPSMLTFSLSYLFKYSCLYTIMLVFLPDFVFLIGIVLILLLMVRTFVLDNPRRINAHS